ncbi:expressed unknown protein [Seminavis robusta]|uniref:PDZ domain-containing protein n=1 Tax=Seminavis robusta TaxID=568900 RepID=A0A9N8DLT2_9STRA|nr:expressed unknown protein [Seminavis robusta]|eukprot:Sro213_g088530.1 n/a (230) ;mRNA; r:62708-63397
MTSTMTITATKTSASQKLGLRLDRLENGTYLVKALEAGLLQGSGLQPGQEVLSINGTEVTGMDSNIVLSLLTSAVGEVAIRVVPQIKHRLTSQVQSFGMHCELVDTQPHLAPEFNQTVAQVKMERYRSVPRMLQDMGVSEQTWKHITDAFAKDLVPALKRALAMDGIFRYEMGRYVRAQVILGGIAGKVQVGTESSREKKIHMMTLQSAIQHNNLAMVANNVLAKANAL